MKFDDFKNPIDLIIHWIVAIGDLPEQFQGGQTLTR